jgi:hypothetical protein
MKATRVWAMPTHDTTLCLPIGDIVRRFAKGTVVDPFARNSGWGGEYTNDLNPETKAHYNMDACDFLNLLVEQGVKADCVIFDPPFSPRQIKECYDGIGKKMGQMDAFRTHWKPERDAINKLLKFNGVVLSFGWNTVGMGNGRGYSAEEMLIVCHGPGHNDTLVLVERKTQEQFALDI